MKDQTTRALGRPRRRLPTAVIIICAALGVVLGGVGAYYVFRDREEEPGRRRRSRRSRDDEDSSRRRVEPFRDEQVQLARVEAGVADAPDDGGNWHAINVRQDGSVRIAEGEAPARDEALDLMLRVARTGDTTATGLAEFAPLIVRCDGRAAWRHVVPIVAKLAQARASRFWFAVAEGDTTEGFIPFELPVPPAIEEPGLEHEIHIRFRSLGPPGQSPTAAYRRSTTQSITVDQVLMQDMQQVKRRLERFVRECPKRVRRATILDDPFILAPGPNVPHAWVMEVLACLKRLGYSDVAFLSMRPRAQEEEEEEPPEEEQEPEDSERPFPEINPPSNTPIIAFETDRPAYTRRMYSGRNRKGRSDALGRGKGGTTARAEGAVEAGLKWLARAQEKDGRWDCKRWHGGDHDVGTTGLALLAFLGAGYTHTKGKYKTTVSKGLSWLAANQKPTGAFGYRTFYEQGIATIAVAEAYGLTRSPKVGRMAQKALDFIVGQQPDHGGYRYRGACPKAEGDLSVTGWQILAVKSAICSELRVGPKVVERCRVFLKNSYAGHGKSKYTVGSGAPGSPAIWAIGLCARQFLGGDYDEEIRAAADALLDHGKQAGAGQGSGKLVGDLYYTYYSVLGMYQMGEPWWPLWNEMFRKPLVNCITKRLHDEKGRYVRGSWDPKNHKWASRGGRVYATAMAVLCLEVYYRFLPIYRKRK